MTNPGRFVAADSRSRVRRPTRQALLRRGMTAALAAVALGMTGSPIVRADHDQEAAARAAREIAATQDRANAAAQAMFDTANELEQLAIDIAAAETELAEIEARAIEVRAGAEARAVARYVGSGAQPIAVFASPDDLNDSMSADVYAGVVADVAMVDLDTLDQVARELDAARDHLDERRGAAEEAEARYRDLKTRAEADLEQLEELEQVRQRDAQVEHEVQRLAREKAERERLEREQAEREAAEQAAAASGGDGSGNDSAADDAGSSGDGPSASASLSIVCPIAGPRAFGDTWGAARSGGRSHQGVDMMSPAGTPLVAVESGSVQFKTNGLGGNTVWLSGNSGTNYYYAHLSAWEGSSRPVSQGDVIGYVGATGNTTANHLHLQIHPGGGLAVNPYPYVRAAC